MPTDWDSILTVILFGDCYADGLEMLPILRVCKFGGKKKTERAVGTGSHNKTQIF